jgi:ferredoxin
MTSHDCADWERAIDTLLPAIHEVDQNATRIWFRFYPLALAEAFARSEDSAKLAQRLRLDGRHDLAGQCDTSHWFFYGHRFWPQVKAAVISAAQSAVPSPSSTVDLASVIRGIAEKAAVAAQTDASLVIGLAAAGLMTLQQIGIEGFRASTGTARPGDIARKSPAQVLAARLRDDSQGLMGLIRGAENAKYSVTFDEGLTDGRFTVIKQTPLTNGAARDTRTYSSRPRRCHEGPIPVECRTASCGTCWIGVLAGAEKLSEVENQERKLLRDCGYFTATDTKPIIRLACKAMASGNVTIVVPTWNGFLAKGGLQGL